MQSKPFEIIVKIEGSEMWESLNNKIIELENRIKTLENYSLQRRPMSREEFNKEFISPPFYGPGDDDYGRRKPYDDRHPLGPIREIADGLVNQKQPATPIIPTAQPPERPQKPPILRIKEDRDVRD